MRFALAAALVALAAAIAPQEARAGLPYLHDAETEALAKTALEEYGKADLDGGVEAARANLDALHRMEMESIAQGADFQASQLIRGVLDAGDGPEPEVRTFERLTDEISYNCEPIENRASQPLREFLRCDLGLQSVSELNGLQVYMNEAIGAVSGAESLRSRAAGAINENSGPTTDFAALFKARIEVELERPEARPPRRDVSIASIASADRSGVRLTEKGKETGGSRTAGGYSSTRAAWVLKEAEEGNGNSNQTTESASRLPSLQETVRSVGEADCTAARLIGAIVTIDAPGDGGLDGSLRRSAAREKFDAAVVCWVKQSAALEAQKELIKIEAEKFAAIDACLARIAAGLIHGPVKEAADKAGGDSNAEASLINLDAPSFDEKARRSAAVSAPVVKALTQQDDGTLPAPASIETTYDLALACSAEAASKYIDLMSLIETEPVSKEICEAPTPAAAPAIAEACAYWRLMRVLFAAADTAGECLLADPCKEELTDDNPMKDETARTAAKKRIAALSGCPDAASCASNLRRLTAALKAIEDAKISELRPAPPLDQRLASAKESLKRHAALLNGLIDTVASTASDLGVELAAVEAQLGAVSFVLDAAVAGQVPSFDPDEACADIEDAEAKAACAARIEALGPRYKAAAAIAGSLPGFFDAMTRIVDDLAEPPPLLLVIARNQLGARSVALRKRLFLLESEIMTWRELAYHYRELVGAARALVLLMKPLCEAYDRGTGVSCVPADAALKYKSKQGGASERQRQALLRAAARFAQARWLERYGESAAFSKLIHLGHLNVAVIGEESISIADAAIDAMLAEIDFRGKRGLRPESVADFASRLANLGLLTAVAVRGE